MNFYLEKYGFCPHQLSSKPSKELGVIIVIPCYNEPDLLKTLNSLDQCETATTAVEVIVVVNSSDHESHDVLEQNEKSISAFNDWNPTSAINFELIHFSDMPRKHAGVGLARKIGMDEAVYRFDLIDHDGIIVCLDADATVESNYLQRIYQHFQEHPKSPGCSVYFEHPLQGDQHESKVYEAILNYELHLRYYKQVQEQCGLPYAFHTIGSSMAVKSSAYQKQGGMNKRKAGEDFYFLHKIIALGGFTELNETCVYPSPRVSDRVPFGTGKAVGEYIENKPSTYDTYAFESFSEIKNFVDFLPQLHKGIEFLDEVPVCVEFRAWLALNDFLIALDMVRDNSTNYASFEKRFFAWFDAFKVLKVAHYLRDNAYPNEPILHACEKLTGIKTTKPEMIQLLRQLDRKRITEQ